MLNLLVVDDSAVDRRYIGDLLGRDSDICVEYAAQGVEALARIQQARHDLVVTDLVMPEMNGLELVTVLRERHPRVPVILMTSRGSEEVAVQALQRGAASYVPKRALGRQLLETIHRVWAVSGRERGHWRLMGRMTENNCAFVLENDAELILPLVAYLQDSLGQLGLCDEADRTRVGVALEEALANALHHGNLEIGSELRGRDDPAYYALVADRRARSPYRDRRIHIEATLTTHKAIFIVRDEGSGFDPSQLPDPTDPANLEKASGRGILLMRTFMDEVAFNDQGNAVTLTKMCRPEHRPTP
jgi:CheY-like chemotaxis protein/anti-sigma regulatory factor (Ser/Thr protein kinase)